MTPSPSVDVLDTQGCKDVDHLRLAQDRVKVAEGAFLKLYEAGLDFEKMVPMHQVLDDARADLETLRRELGIEVTP